jgi:hypothetical protein
VEEVEIFLPAQNQLHEENDAGMNGITAPDGPAVTP